MEIGNIVAYILKRSERNSLSQNAILYALYAMDYQLAVNCYKRLTNFKWSVYQDELTANNKRYHSFYNNAFFSEYEEQDVLYILKEGVAIQEPEGEYNYIYDDIFSALASMNDENFKLHIRKTYGSFSDIVNGELNFVKMINERKENKYTLVVSTEGYEHNGEIILGETQVHHEWSKEALILILTQYEYEKLMNAKNDIDKGLIYTLLVHGQSIENNTKESMNFHRLVKEAIKAAKERIENIV
jgi:hypothetical protein